MAQKLTFNRNAIISGIAGIGLVSGVMSFFGIPGVFPALIQTTAIDLSDVSFCDSLRNSACKGILLSEPPEETIIVADKVTFSTNMTLNPDTIILANEINLGGNEVTGTNRLVIFAREAGNGQLRVNLDPDDTKQSGELDGLNGISAGELIGVIGEFAPSLTIDMTGSPGRNGLSGKNGGNGKDGKCGGFGSYEGNRPGKDGQRGGNGGDGGNGGSIDV